MMANEGDKSDRKFSAMIEREQTTLNDILSDCSWQRQVSQDTKSKNYGCEQHMRKGSRVAAKKALAEGKQPYVTEGFLRLWR